MLPGPRGFYPIKVCLMREIRVVWSSSGHTATLRGGSGGAHSCIMALFFLYLVLYLSWFLMWLPLSFWVACSAALPDSISSRIFMSGISFFFSFFRCCCRYCFTTSMLFSFFSSFFFPNLIISKNSNSQHSNVSINCKHSSNTALPVCLHALIATG